MSRFVFVLGACLALGTPMYAASATPSPAAQAQTTDGLAAKVKARIDAEPDLKNQSIHVSAEKETVTLEGEVPSVVARAKAGELAMKTDGVKKVKNKLKLADAD